MSNLKLNTTSGGSITLTPEDNVANTVVTIPSGTSTVVTAASLASSLAGSSASAGVGYLPSGTGAVASTVQEKLRERVSVLDFGAVGDGVADDTAAIQNAISAVVSGTVYFPRGTYKTTATIYVPYGVTIYGDGVQHVPSISITGQQGSVIWGQHTGAAVLSLKGAYNCRISDIIIVGDPSTIPKTGLCLGRSSVASAGRHYIENINVVGYFSKAAIYSIASEENTWIIPRANVLGGGAQYTFFTAESDALSVDTLTTNSNFTSWVYGFNFLHQADYTGDPTRPTFAIYAEIGSATQTWGFKGGFTGMTSQVTGSSHIRVQMTATPLGDFTFEDIGCESSNSLNPPLQVMYVGGPGFVLKGLRMTNVSGGQFQSGQTHFINVQGGAEIENADIRCSKTDHQSSFSIVRKSNISILDQDLHIDYISIGNTFNARQLYLLETAGGSRSNNIANCPSFGKVTFGGGAVNDFSIDATSLFTGIVNRSMVVKIDGTGAPNTFTWSKDGGATWDAAGVAITGSAQTLTEGIVIKFVATTGHTMASQWSFIAEPNVLMT
jgi:hypothetical protein